jgi:2-keto-3-deoxy-L-rhamnonate aldolase RhmA
MRMNAAKAKLAAGQPISVIAPGYSSPGLVELLAYLGFDAVFLDCEHGASDWEDVENMVRAAELYGTTPIVRVQANDGPTISRALDRGAGGVQIPHVNTRAEAEAAVRAAKYAPLGHRGFAGGRASFGESAASYTERANQETMVVVMLEEVEALRNLDEILQIEQIDAFFVAPGDLSQSMGLPGLTDHPAVREAIDAAVRRISDAGRAPGVLANPQTVDHYLQIGALFIYVALGSLLMPAAADFVARFRGSRS